MNAKKPHPVDIEVGNRIRLRRKLSGMSQSALGQALGITFQQVQKYERGANRVGSSRLSHIADVLGVHVSHFFPDTTSPDSGVKGAAAPDPVVAFLGTVEGRNLNIAFTKITSSAVRRKVVGLVTALSEIEDEAEQDHRGVT